MTKPRTPPAEKFRYFSPSTSPSRLAYTAMFALGALVGLSECSRLLRPLGRIHGMLRQPNSQPGYADGYDFVVDAHCSRLDARRAN